MNKITLEIMVKSANVFKNVNYFSSKMNLYAVAAVLEGDNYMDKSCLQKTMVDKHGGAQPFWWFPMKFQINELKLLSENMDLSLVIRIECRRTLGSDKNIGSVRLPLKTLLEYYYLINSEGNSFRHVAFTILSRSGKSRGVLYLSYMLFDFGNHEKIMNVVPSAPPLPPRDDCDDLINDNDQSTISDGQILLSAAERGCNIIPSAPYLPVECASH